MLYTDSNLSISVITDSKINSIFVKANNHILTKYSDKFKNTSDDLKSKILKECWVDEFKADLDIDNLAILFQRKKDMTIFLLTWT